MPGRRLTQILTDERGAALPLALIAMVMLTTLIVAFSVLATTEPLIANNQLTVAQARAITETGVERAIWALNNDTNASGLPNPLPGTVPAPYDGSTPINVTLGATTLGVYKVTVMPGLAPNERRIEALGFLPSEASPRAKQRIQVTVVKFNFVDPPAALSVRGELQMGGNTNISSNADRTCGAKAGTFTTGATSTSGSATVYGSDNPPPPASPSAPNQATDILQVQPTATFDTHLLSDSDMAALKAYAKTQGTYYQGAVTFNSSNQMPNGVVFVDTVSGNPVTATSDPADMAVATIHGNAPSSADGIFKGWLIVNGSLAISGNFQMWGFGYIQNDFTYTGTGTGQIVGAMLSRNIQDTSSTTIDTNTGGNASIVYDCAKARGAGFVPLTYTVKPGTYKELSD
jgi:hypothetical protein